jgi:DNA-binding PadR family transcriptional regulator
VAKRRRLSNPLALAVLAAVAERPMHPYEMASTLRARGKDHSIKINWGSLYTVVQNLEKYQFIEATGTTRQGRRPERTVYSITDAGRDELEDWLRELVRVPEREYARFEAALSLLPVLPPEEAAEMLEQRVRRMDLEITSQQAVLDQVSKEIPRLFLIEAEYHVAMLRAEAEFVRCLQREVAEGTLPGIEGWHVFHETGDVGELSGQIRQERHGSDRPGQDSPVQRKGQRKD